MLHAVIQPSSAHRWVNCPGSIQAEATMPNLRTDASDEGDAIHEIAAEMLRSRAQSPNKLPDEIPPVASNGVVLTDDLIEVARMYVDDVHEYMGRFGVFGGDSLRIEQSVTMPSIHDLNWGTYDCAMFANSEQRIVVWDLKAGRKVVEAHENWQLINYVIGILDEMPNVSDLNLSIELRIIQPRAFHREGPKRSWHIKAHELRAHRNLLSYAAHKSQEADPETKAGVWCDNCRAASRCHTLQNAVAGTMDRIQTLELHELTPSQRSVELKQLRDAKIMLDERLESLETESLELLRTGVAVPGFACGTGRGSKVWTKSPDEIFAMGDLMGINLRNVKPVTPNQAVKLGIDEAVISSYHEHRPGASRLVESKESEAALIFKR